MTHPTDLGEAYFNLALTTAERYHLIRVLAGSDFSDLFRRLVELHPSLDPPAQTGTIAVHSQWPETIPSGGTAAAAAVLAPATPAPGSQPPKIRWAEKAKPSTAEPLEITPEKVDRRDTDDGRPRLVVSWIAPNRAAMVASVWDQKLFGPIANRLKQPTRFFVTRKDRYINIVGVEA